MRELEMTLGGDAGRRADDIYHGTWISFFTHNSVSRVLPRAYFLFVTGLSDLESSLGFSNFSPDFQWIAVVWH